MATSKRVYAKGATGEPLPTHASTGGPPTPAGSFDSASGGVTAPLLWSWCAQNFVYVLQDWSLFFPSVLWKSYNQILLAFRVRFPGLPVPLSDPMAGKPDMGFRTFTTLRELLWHYCSPACGSPTQKIWDLIFFMTVCLLLSNLGFFFFSGCGVCSFGGFQCHPVWLQIFAGCPPAKLVAILVLSQEEDECTSFYYLPS